MSETPVNSAPPNHSQPSILWLQVLGLAVMQGAITLCWVIYNLYLPQLLKQFGFPVALATTLLIIEKFLAAVMEPIMGGLSDQTRRWMGTRFPFITGGMILASALFIGIPTVVIFGNPTTAFRWMLLIIIIAWAFAMTIFRSPAISLLWRYATPPTLPLAASLLTLTGGLIGAFQPVASQQILSWGSAVTFALGSFVLLAAATLLRWVNGSDSCVSSPNSPPPIPFLPLGLIFLTGGGVAWGSSFLMQTIQKVMKHQFSTIDIKVIMLGIGIALALTAIPAGAIASKLGNHPMMLSGIGITMGLMMLIVVAPYPWMAGVGLIGLIPGFSLIVNGAIPYALCLVPPEWGGLGIGTYFGGLAAAGALFGLLFTQPSLTLMASGTTALWGAIAFLLTAFCLIASQSIQPMMRSL